MLVWVCDQPCVCLQEWDYPGEYFYDPSTETLYFNYNGTGTPPSDNVVATNLKVMFNITSSRWDPITNLTLQGLQFTATAYTYMVLYCLSVCLSVSLSLCLVSSMPFVSIVRMSLSRS